MSETEQGVATVVTNDGQEYWIAIVDDNELGVREVYLMKGNPSEGKEQQLYLHREDLP